MPRPGCGVVDLALLVLLAHFKCGHSVAAKAGARFLVCVTVTRYGDLERVQ